MDESHAISRLDIQVIDISGRYLPCKRALRRTLTYNVPHNSYIMVAGQKSSGKIATPLLRRKIVSSKSIWKIALAAVLVMLAGVILLLAAGDSGESDAVLTQLHMLKRSSPTLPSHRRIRKSATYDGDAADQHSVRSTSLFVPPAGTRLHRASQSVARATALASFATCVLRC